MNLGAHGVVYDFTTDEGWQAGFEELADGPDVVVGGGTVEALGLGPTDWFLEVDGFAFPDDRVFGGEPKAPGFAAYLSTAIYAGKTTTLVELKRYRNAERVNGLLAPELYEIAIGPTLEYERAITEDSSATVNSNNSFGGRVRTDVAAVPGVLTPYASLAVFRDLDQSPLHFNPVPETVYHPMLGLDFTKDGWAVLANAGFRVDDRDGTDLGSDRQLHGDLVFRAPLPQDMGVSLSAGAEWFQWGVNPIQQHDYVEMESSVSLQWKGPAHLHLVHRLLDEPPHRQHRQPLPGLVRRRRDRGPSRARGADPGPSTGRTSRGSGARAGSAGCCRGSRGRGWR